MSEFKRETEVDIPIGPPFSTIDDWIIKVLGKWCIRCKRVTKPYLGDKNEWPCCSGCW